MNKKILIPIILLALVVIIIAGYFILQKSSNNLGEYSQQSSNNLGEYSQLNITRTSGTYNCPTCSEPHKWYIDETHIMYWDGEPYIPHGLSGPRDYKNISKTYEFIDNLAKKGVKDYMLWYEGDQDKLSKIWTTEEYNNWIDKTTNYIISKGGTYIFIIQPTYIWEPSAGTRRDTAFMNRSDIKERTIEEFKRFKPLIAKEGLRGLGYSSEINTMEHTGILAPKSEDGFDDFKKMLNDYAKAMKDVFGDLPVIFRMDSHTNYISYLYAMNSDHIDGIIAEYNQFTPNDVKSEMSRSPYIKYFNSFKKTKFMWTNLQVNFETTTTWVPYVSYDVMWEHHKIAIENGATGNLLDMSNYDWVLNNCKCGSLDDTHKWYGEFKEKLKNYILEKAKTKEFLTGKYAPSKDLEFKYKSPTMKSDKVISIIMKDKSVSDLLKKYPILTISADPPVFDTSTGEWHLALSSKSGKEFYAFIVDDKTGKIIRNSVTLEKEAEALRYTYTIKDELEAHIKQISDGANNGGSGQNESCTVGTETGVKCPSVDKCSSGEWVDGCCIAGQCL